MQPPSSQSWDHDALQRSRQFTLGAAHPQRRRPESRAALLNPRAGEVRRKREGDAIGQPRAQLAAGTRSEVFPRAGSNN